MVSSYVVDGFATCGTVVNARVLGEAHAKFNAWRGEEGRGRRSGDEHEAVDEGVDEGVDEFVSDERSAIARALGPLRSTSLRLLGFGVAGGCAFLLALHAARDALIAAFTSDPEVRAILVEARVWRVLALAQPLNASVFVYDGLAYAFQDFGFVREAFEVGVGFVFAPSLAAVALAYGAIGSSVPSGVMRGTFETAGIEGPTGVETPGAGLAAIWTCKVALNACLLYTSPSPRD